MATLVSQFLFLPEQQQGMIWRRSPRSRSIMNQSFQRAMDGALQCSYLLPSNYQHSACPRARYLLSLVFLPS